MVDPVDFPTAHRSECLGHAVSFEGDVRALEGIEGAYDSSGASGVILVHDSYRHIRR